MNLLKYIKAATVSPFDNPWRYLRIHIDAARVFSDIIYDISAIVSSKPLSSLYQQFSVILPLHSGVGGRGRCREDFK
jgi:hypothetical protein